MEYDFTDLINQETQRGKKLCKKRQFVYEEFHFSFTHFQT